MNALLSAFSEGWVLTVQDVLFAAVVGALIGAYQGRQDHMRYRAQTRTKRD